MRKMILGMMMSLDGYGAGVNDEMDWLPPFDDSRLWKDAHEEMWNELDTIDTFVLGRVTYQIWEKYWPMASKNPAVSDSDRRFSQFAEETQKIVLSTTLTDVKWKNSLLVKDNAKEELLKLKAQSGKNIAVAGGPGLARSISGMGLVDEYLITVHPVLLGKGKPLFNGLDNRLKLNLVRTRNLESGAVLLHYRSEDA